ncbi:hypothetical protein [uncultured Hoeflea sp.]|uniref:hypothetical protein n=1 Tax=uncultured Hoeflea sp. TaxID=538666 RepID=UPI002638FCFA|nr:hypothetical protein [uncultured Hoeflea sp.]
MRLFQTGLAAMGLGFAALIIYAIADGSFLVAGAWLTSEPWGLVTLADLYLGFVLSALVIWWFEPSPVKRLLWILPIPFLGNVWTVIWFILRLPHLRERLTRR